MFTEQFQKKIKVIETEDFLNLEFKEGGLLSWVDATQREKMLTVSKGCVSQKIGMFLLIVLPTAILDSVLVVNSFFSLNYVTLF